MSNASSSPNSRASEEMEEEENRHQVELEIQNDQSTKKQNENDQDFDASNKTKKDIESQQQDHRSHTHNSNSIYKTITLSIASLGVVYGDIGTSPLYTLATLFPNGVEETNDVVGGVSLIIWSLILLVSIKYVILMLFANNHGEGGIFALLGLLQHSKQNMPKILVRIVPFVAMLSASFLFGDGALTPAISILSAVEGIAVFDSNLKDWILPITILILILLFGIQRFGTEKVSVLFSPICFAWFVALASMGIANCIDQPQIFNALNPIEAITFVVRKQSIQPLAATFLAVTGMEALYADLSHFGPTAIRLSWFSFLMPALILNYLGQGAVLLGNPTDFSHPFFASVPAFFYWPIVILATFATIIASQAMITGIFSLVSQAISLGLFPPVTLVHTSKSVVGQVYIPIPNWWILVNTMLIVLVFRSSSAIGNAYGFTIAADGFLATWMFFFVCLYHWKISIKRIYPLIYLLLFITIDGIYLSAQITKIPSGGWFSVVMSFMYFYLMLGWYYGSYKLNQWLDKWQLRLKLSELQKLLSKVNGNESTDPKTLANSLRMDQFRGDITSISISKNEQQQLESEKQLAVFQKFGVFVTTHGISQDVFETQQKPEERELLSSKQIDPFMPAALSNLIQHVQAIPKEIIILDVSTSECPNVPINERIREIKNLGSHVWSIKAKYGYADDIRSPLEILAVCMASNQSNYTSEEEEKEINEAVNNNINNNEETHRSPQRPRHNNIPPTPFPTTSLDSVAFFMNRAHIKIAFKFIRSPFRYLLLLIFKFLKTLDARSETIDLPYQQLVEVSLIAVLD